jgi:hypothetical protein
MPVALNPQATTFVPVPRPISRLNPLAPTFTPYLAQPSSTPYEAAGAFLSALPTEILNVIAGHLDLLSFIKLRGTCGRLRGLESPRRISKMLHRLFGSDLDSQWTASLPKCLTEREASGFNFGSPWTASLPECQTERGTSDFDLDATLNLLPCTSVRFSRIMYRLCYACLHIFPFETTSTNNHMPWTNSWVECRMKELERLDAPTKGPRPDICKYGESWYCCCAFCKELSCPESWSDVQGPHRLEDCVCTDFRTKIGRSSNPAFLYEYLE